MDGKRYEMQGPQTLAYYLYPDCEEDDFTKEEYSTLITKAGQALDCAMLENPSLPLAA